MAKRRRVKENILKGFHSIGSIAGILALIIAILGTVLALNAKNSVPKKPQMQAETLAYSRVENYAKNFFQVWAMGDKQSASTLKEFYSANPLNDLNADPAQITDLNTADIKVQPTPQNEILWTVTLGATMKSPGLGEPTRNFYDISILQKDKSLTIAKLPNVVELDRPKIEAENVYSSSVPSNNPLYQVSVNFASTYLTPQNAESFGRYVTADFKGNPLANSPYSGANVTGVYLPFNTVTDQFKAGDMTSVLIRVRASTSQSTYQTMDMIVTAVIQSNGQWLINSIDTAPQTGKSKDAETGSSGLAKEGSPADSLNADTAGKDAVAPGASTP